VTIVPAGAQSPPLRTDGQPKVFCTDQEGARQAPRCAETNISCIMKKLGGRGRSQERVTHPLSRDVAGDWPVWDVPANREKPPRPSRPSSGIDNHLWPAKTGNEFS
jgi:hypothetical protein